ncbi:MAG TPA: LuxR C-terminal-related transcriptional regulator [Chloroflexia bacterium]
MSTVILATRLFIPPPPPKVVLRPRLVARLNEGLHRKLTLISAPAGFGKTTLLSEWVAGSDTHVAWLSLDERDSDPVRFLTYMVAALRTIAPTIGEGVLGVLQSSQPPSTEAILTALLNEISTIPDNSVLVLDDYHVIDSHAVDEALTFLLEHLPAQMHVVITTREDPQLPLARLRARGQLTELRATDLRFTPGEAAAFLNQVMGLDIAAQDVTALETRTEGWIAGLQLAALSMRGREDIPAFIKAFAGDNRYIVDYLVEEVLQRQPEPVQSFLLQTSILDRMCGPLCDAVTRQEGGKKRLEALERGNFFVVPLDDNRHWYRYHHLFAEVLSAHLMAEQPDQVSTLHQRASEWYEHHGSAAEAIPNAIRHALAAQDFRRAADLVERAWTAMLRSRQEAMMLGWLKALPDEVVRVRPVLSIGYATALMASGVLDGVEARLRDAERWLDTSIDRPDRSERIIVDEEAFRHLPGQIAVARAGLALSLGDVAGTMQYARLVLDLIPEDDHLRRGSAEALLGLASWTSGDLEAAHRAYADGRASLHRAGHISDVLGCTIALADIRMAQGRLQEAMRTFEQALQLTAEQTAHGAPALRGTADMHVGMSALYREHNDLHAATRHLLRSKELGDHNGLPQNPYRWRVAMARIREAEGDLDGALDLLQEAERVYIGDFSPNVRPVAASKTRVWVMQGKLGEALGWARGRGLSAHDDLSYLREFEHITLVRLLLAQYKSERTERFISEAMGLLERLLKAAEEGGRTGSVIEILVLQALGHQTRRDIPAALVPLEQALMLAEPEGYVRIFVDEGSPMATLLEEAAKHGVTSSYVRRLLSALGETREAGKAEERTPVKQVLIEPLSQRELEVLRLLRTELTGPEIAHQLMVSLHTMRTHTNNIYIKLGVNNRRAAVRRAEELHLL